MFSATAGAAAGSRYRPAYAATLADWRSRWASAAITRGVVVQPSFFGTDNAETLAAVATDPQHLRAVAVVDPGFDGEALARLAAGGVRALRLNLKSVADYAAYATPGWRALFDRVHALGWHVEIYVDTGRLPEIVPAFRDSPIAVVFDHFGNPGASPGAQDATFAAVAALAQIASRVGQALRALSSRRSRPRRARGALDRERRRAAAGVGQRLAVDQPREREQLRTAARLARPLGRRGRARAIVWDNAARLYGFS